jgi:AcrR family transcriptional regulator
MPSPLRYLDDPTALEQERAVFVSAAFELLADSDTVDLQVSAVVKQAGRHNAGFYRVFGSKDGLTLAVVAEATRRTAVIAERRVARASSAQDAVRAWAIALLRVASARVAPGAQAFALDRQRLLHRFPDAEDTLTQPLREPLARILEQAAVPDARLRADAAYELVMSRQASWIALGHRPGDAEVRTYADLVVRLVGIADV